MLFFGDKNNKQTSVGIDIGTTSLKAVQLSKDKGSVTVDTYGELALGPYAGLEVGQAVRLGDLKLEEALKDLFKEAKISTEIATIGIETNSSFITSVRVPLVSREELRTMMPLEARRYIPIPMSEVQLDFWPVPGYQSKDKDGKALQEIVIAAVRNDTLQKYDRIAKALNLKDVELEIEGFSVVRSSLTETGKLMMIFDYGGEYSAVSLVRSGVVLDMHVVPRGSQDSTLQLSRSLAISHKVAEELKRKFGWKGTSDSPFMQEVMELSSYPLLGEVARLIIMYERKYGQAIDGVVVTGGGAKTIGLLEQMSKVTHVPVRIANPFESTVVPEFLRDIIVGVGPTYACAVGLALKKLK